MKIGNARAFGKHCLHDAKKRIQYNINTRGDPCFVRWYEILDESLVEVDTDNMPLDCVTWGGDVILKTISDLSLDESLDYFL